MKVFFYFVIAVMVTVSAWASFDSNVWQGFQYLFANRWGIATLGDTYFAFFIIYLFIANREKTLGSRAIWFVLVMSLGTIAISIYMLKELAQSKKLV